MKSVSLDSFNNIPTTIPQYSYEYISSNNVIILELLENKITIGITENTNDHTLKNLINFHNEQIDFVKIEQVELSSWLNKQLGDNFKSSEIVTNVNKNEKTLLDKIANDAPTVNLVNSICMEALRNNASDIHIESGEKNARVRYRIDGLLKTFRYIEIERFAAVSSRVKIMANLNILEKRTPQDGRITVSINNENIDLRISIVPITNGESIVMRILGKNSAPEQLEKLGFSEKQLNYIKSMINIPHGLILVTGPTGSGKTTTLNSILRELISDEIKIISIEDPVEYIVDGVDQIQINEQIGLTFDVILRRILRQDPNIIMVGEIRDKETAELAVRAALTGHLVLSTLHTNDAISVIPRLINMGIEPYLISSVLKGTIAQRLVRKLDDTKKDFNGRTIISETFIINDDIERIINSDADVNKIAEYFKIKGFDFFKDDALSKINAGITTIEEIKKEIVI